MKILMLISNVDELFEQYGNVFERMVSEYEVPVEIALIDYSTIDIRTGENDTLTINGKTFEMPDAFLAMIDNTDNNIIQELLISNGAESILNIKEFNVARSKILTYERLAKAGIRVPRTLVFFNHMDKEKLVNTLGFPFIVKPDNGYGGEGVQIISNEEELEAYEKTLKYGCAYVAQEFISTSRGKDLRVVVFKGEIIYTIMRQSSNPEEFRSNVHQGGSITEVEIDQATADMCLKIAALFDLPLLGIDLMFGEGEYVVAEVNASPGLQGKQSTVVRQVIINDYLESKEKK